MVSLSNNAALHRAVTVYLKGQCLEALRQNVELKTIPSTTVVLNIHVYHYLFHFR